MNNTYRILRELRRTNKDFISKYTPESMKQQYWKQRQGSYPKLDNLHTTIRLLKMLKRMR